MKMSWIHEGARGNWPSCRTVNLAGAIIATEMGGRGRRQEDILPEQVHFILKSGKEFPSPEWRWRKKLKVLLMQELPIFLGPW